MGNIAATGHIGKQVKLADVSRRIFTFPNPVNEVAARTVAAGVLTLTVLIIVLGSTAGSAWLWLDALLVYGFVARVLSGPTLSLLGQFATRVAAPRIGHEKLVAGPPKRFAQLLGAIMSTTALVLHAAGADTGAYVVLGLIVVAATLESVFAFCVGCTAFAGLMRLGVIPEETCEACANVSLRLNAAS